MPGDLSRRDFLALTASLLVLLRDGAAAASSGARKEIRDGLFGVHPVTAEQLAPYTSLYLARNPSEADADRLIQLLFPPSGGRSVEQLKETVRGLHRKDFEEGRTVNLDGWILSVTEVRLWCLYQYLTV